MLNDAAAEIHADLGVSVGLNSLCRATKANRNKA
jgi:hypothetical protein